MPKIKLIELQRKDLALLNQEKLRAKLFKQHILTRRPQREEES